MPKPSLAKKLQGSLIGFAIGDAMGATTEFCDKMQIQQLYGVVDDVLGGGWLQLKPGEVTDDTQMMLCVCRALRKEQSAVFQFKRLCANNFVRWYESKPKDVGGACARGISYYKEHGEYIPVTKSALGNGALMRAVPCALMGLENFNVQQGMITHNNEMQSKAIEAFSKLLNACLDGTYRVKRRPALMEPSGHVQNTFNNAIHWGSQRDFETAVKGAVNDGGDADTIAAITGAIAGARFGIDAIPKRWLEKLDYDVFVELKKFARFVENYLQV